MRIKLMTAFASLAFASTSQAAWHQASSKHFLIYADMPPARLLEFATKLEKFDKAVRLSRHMPDPPVGNGNRLTVFMVSNDAAVRQILRDGPRLTAGFYSGLAVGPLAVVPKSITGEGDYAMSPENVLFHEYAHHLMYQQLNLPMPAWLSEGFAEFLSTAQFEKNGAMGFGFPPQYRAESIAYYLQVPLEQVLSGTYKKMTDEQSVNFYGRAWLMTHYLTFEPARRGQLDRYISRIARGDNALQAARSAFGDLKSFEDDLDKYSFRRKLGYARVDASELVVGKIEVRPLSSGEAAVLPLRMISKRGVDKSTAASIVAKMREAAGPYPNDPFVQASLAEAEQDAGFYQNAVAAADRALAANSREIEAMLHKGRALLTRMTQESSGRAKLAGEARNLFIAANKIDPEDPEPLMLFYDSFKHEGISPTPNAIAAVHYAADLAPQDNVLRITSALQYLESGEGKEARHRLVPIAFDPHGKELADMARKAINFVDSGNLAAARGAFESIIKK